ncbi:MAG TPA: hypothetical protein EYO84_11150 [Planctomycetes bacterium]|nr:hypothetical protein [Planctomycetota bacterium]
MANDFPFSIKPRPTRCAKVRRLLLKKCGLLAYSPLAGGRLSGKYMAGKKPEMLFCLKNSISFQL